MAVRIGARRFSFMDTPNRKLKVYLVEDSPILATGLLELLHRKPEVRVVGQSNRAATAISEISALKPDLVISDIALQSGSGFDVLKAFWARNVTQRPVFFMFSNFCTAPYREAARRFGADRFFDKSADLFEMLGAVCRMTNLVGDRR